ncbi:MAG: hypothetical protein R3E32_23845 [Chitinophagales bacterium]
MKTKFNLFLIAVLLYLFNNQTYAQPFNPSGPEPTSYFKEQSILNYCKNYDQYNAIVDFWNSEERPLMEAAAKKLLAKENKPSSQSDINQLQAQLKTDPVRRFQYAPYMLFELYKALETTSPNAAQTAYQKRYNKCVACKNWLFANQILEDWKIHTRDPSGVLQPAPQGGYQPLTFSIWRDVLRDRATKKGFIADEINAIYSTPAGDEQLSKLLAPMMAKTITDFGDRTNLKSLGDDMHAVLQGTIGASATVLGVAATGAFVFNTAYTQAKFTFTANEGIKVRDLENAKAAAKELGEEGSRQFTDDATKKVTKEITEEVIETNSKLAAKKASKQASKQILKKAGENMQRLLLGTGYNKATKTVIGKFLANLGSKMVGIAAVVGTLATMGQILGEEIADVATTQAYDQRVRAEAQWRDYNVTQILNPSREELTNEIIGNREFYGYEKDYTVTEEQFRTESIPLMDAKKVRIFKDFLYFNVSLPAERGQLTFEYPEIPVEYGKKKGLNGVQVLDVQFLNAYDQTLEHAKKIAQSNDWRLATEAEVLRAMFYLQKSGPRGMTADGSFVMPVTQTFTDSKGKTYKTGLNKNIEGTNDGFYYVKLNPTPGRKPAVEFLKSNRQPNSEIVEFQNAWLKSFIQADKNGNLALSQTKAGNESDWKIIYIMEGRVRLQHVASGRYLLAKYNSVDKKNTHLVFEPLKEPASYPIAHYGSWIIEKTGDKPNWYRIKTDDGLYLHTQDVKLQLSTIEPNWFSPTWMLQAPRHDEEIKKALLSYSFQRQPYENGYHGGSFTEGANGTLIWTNDVGASWATKLDFDHNQLDATIGSNPYKNQPNGKAFLFKLSNGNLTGLEFNGEIYHLTELPAKGRVVKFHSQTGLSLAQAQNTATVRGWKMASPSDIQQAWKNQNLDVYAFGMMADGRFAVPVQSDHSNFKKGANIGAIGGNQGFFYTTASENIAPPKPNTSTNLGTVPTYTNKTDTSSTNNNTTPNPTNQLVDLNATYYITDAKHNNSLVTGNVYVGGVYHLAADFRRTDASWYFIPTGDGYYYIYDLKFNKALVAIDYGYLTTAIRLQDPNGETNAQWKITPSPVAGKYIITDRKNNKALVAGDVADNNIYHQPHNNRPNAYWSLIATDHKAPANKPNPNAKAPTDKPKPEPTATYKPQPKPTGYIWLDNDFIRIQNSSTNTHYLHIQNGKLVNGPIQADDLSAQWKFIPIGNSKNLGGLQNRSNPELYLDRINGEFTITKTSQRPAWGGLVWGLFPKNEQQHADLVRIQGTTAPYETAYLENGKAKLEELDAAEQENKLVWWKISNEVPNIQPNTTNTNSVTPKIHQWLDNGYVRIRNRLNQYHYLYDQNGQLKDGPVGVDQLTAQWKILPAPSKGYVFIQNRANPELYLNNTNGKLEVKKVHHMSTSSVQWKINPLPGGWALIENAWYNNQYIHNQQGELKIGEVDINWAGSYWEIR